MKPNLFNFATSELSQDAFIAWLIAWADKKHKNSNEKLHELAKSFVKLLIQKDENFEIESIKVKKQWKKIDVSALVNDSIFIVIEDKTYSKAHSNQLERYHNIAKKHYNSDVDIKLIYYKMIEQGNYKTVDQAGYSIVSRKKMIEILTGYVGKIPKSANDIVKDYYDYLVSLDDKINAFKTKDIEDWNRYQWIGFYTALQKQIDGQWAYVSNAKGGFLGFDWSYHNLNFKSTKVQQYLQLEENKLVFKLYVKDGTNRKKIRDQYRKVLLNEAKKNHINIKKSGRLGKTMSIAHIKSDYRILDSNKSLDLETTISYLTNIAKFQKSLVKLF